RAPGGSGQLRRIGPRADGASADRRSGREDDPAAAGQQEQSGAQGQQQHRTTGDQADRPAGGWQVTTLAVVIAGERFELGRRDRDRVLRVDDGGPLVPDVHGQPGRGGQRHGGGVTARHLYLERLPGAGREGEPGVLGGGIVDDDRE